jgi:hypothetical protein
MRPLLGLLALLAASLPAFATVFPPPRDDDYHSDNGKFTAHLTYAREGKPARLEVRPAGDKAAPPLWTATLTSAPRPMTVLLSDDGRHAVTVDSWRGYGSGDDVLAFYDKTGQLKRYSLDQLLEAQNVPKDKWPAESQIGRVWRGTTLLDDHEGSLLLAIEFKRAGRWVAWHARTGKVANVDDRLAARWGVLPLERARRTAAGDRFSVLALLELAQRKHPQDRPLIERWLHSKRFDQYLGHRDTPFGEPTEWLQLSRERQDADYALRLFDGKSRDAESPYVYLGVIRGTIKLPSPPTDAKARVHVYLLPESVATDGWRTSDPLHHLHIDPNAPRRRPEGANANAADVPLDIRFVGVDPGRYWIKVVYDRTAPFCDDARKICAPGPGDLENDDRSLLDASAGKATVVEVSFDKPADATGRPPARKP